MRRIVTQSLAEADGLCGRAHVGAPRAAAVEEKGETDVRGNLQRWHQVDRLEDEVDPLAAEDRQPPFAELAEVDVAERNRARRRSVEAGRDVQERALP